MNHKLFIDTNIFLDVIFNRYKPSQDLLQIVQSEHFEAYISVRTVMDVQYFVKKTLTKNKLKELLTDLVNSYTFLTTSKDHILKALSSQFSDFEDGVQHFTALSVPGITGIITRNKKDFKHSQIPVFTPREYLIMLH